MAASAWGFYNKFKEYMADGTIDLDTQNFHMVLATSASNAETATLSTYASITNEVASANGYTQGGKTLAAVTWATGASASEMRFDSTATVWSATGSIANVKYAIVKNSAGKLCFYSKLSTGQFTITSGNTLTVTPSANGYFELN